MEPRKGARSAEKPARTASKPTTTFNAQAFLDSAGMSRQTVRHKRGLGICPQGDLIDQLFNSSEKRLARTLLLLARYGGRDRPARVVPKISQETLAEMVGTTRSRVNFFLNKFKKLGFIEYKGELPLKINSSLLSVVLHD